MTLESELIPESESGETGETGKTERGRQRGCAGCGGGGGCGGLRIRGQRAQHRGKESNGLIDAMTISSKSTDKTRDRSSLALSFDRSFVREAAFHSKMEEYLSRFDIINEYNSDEEGEEREEEDSSDLHLGFHS